MARCTLMVAVPRTRTGVAGGDEPSQNRKRTFGRLEGARQSSKSQAELTALTEGEEEGDDSEEEAEVAGPTPQRRRRERERPASQEQHSARVRALRGRVLMFLSTFPSAGRSAEEEGPDSGRDEPGGEWLERLMTSLPSQVFW
jgi:hypothetical protein